LSRSTAFKNIFGRWIEDAIEEKLEKKRERSDALRKRG